MVLNGITVEDLQKMINVRPVRTATSSASTSRSIGADGRANPRVIALADQPRRAGPVRLSLRPGLLDRGSRPRQELPARWRSRINFEALFINAFNHRNTLVGGTGGATFSIDSTTFGQIDDGGDQRAVRFSSGSGFISRVVRSGSGLGARGSGHGD